MDCVPQAGIEVAYLPRTQRLKSAMALSILAIYIGMAISGSAIVAFIISCLNSFPFRPPTRPKRSRPCSRGHFKPEPLPDYVQEDVGEASGLSHKHVPDAAHKTHLHPLKE